jgi:hypothetical protein
MRTPANVSDILMRRPANVSDILMRRHADISDILMRTLARVSDDEAVGNMGQPGPLKMGELGSDGLH